jgi:myo-inositol 2-dehydrogenase/D-chiro-inositol 1-dehydrogenase
LHEARAFVAAVQGGAGADLGVPAGATLADALEATRIGMALRQSLQSGEAVTL